MLLYCYSSVVFVEELWFDGVLIENWRFGTNSSLKYAR